MIFGLVTDQKVSLDLMQERVHQVCCGSAVVLRVLATLLNLLESFLMAGHDTIGPFQNPSLFRILFLHFPLFWQFLNDKRPLVHSLISTKMVSVGAEMINNITKISILYLKREDVR
jgi:hypothetical protein